MAQKNEKLKFSPFCCFLAASLRLFTFVKKAWFTVCRFALIVQSAKI